MNFFYQHAYKQKILKDFRLKNYINMKWQFSLISYEKNQLKWYELIGISQVRINRAQSHNTVRAYLINFIFDELSTIEVHDSQKHIFLCLCESTVSVSHSSFNEAALGFVF